MPPEAQYAAELCCAKAVGGAPVSAESSWRILVPSRSSLYTATSSATMRSTWSTHTPMLKLCCCCNVKTIEYPKRIHAFSFWRWGAASVQAVFRPIWLVCAPPQLAETGAA